MAVSGMDEQIRQQMSHTEWGIFVANRIANRGQNVRVGQEFFNALYEIRPMIARGLTASLFDPFYKDYVSAECLDFVRRNWEWADA